MAQLTYEYTATLVYSNGGKNIPIDQSQIKSIIINKKFNQLTMPVITMQLNLDRLMADTMINNKKTASLILKMNKIQTSNTINVVEEAYFVGEFMYLIEDDVSKTNKIKYSDPDMKDEQKQDADKFRPIKIGLISKTMSDLARQPNNFTVYNTNMQDIVVKLLSCQMPVLIEPFTYNDKLDQVIIPPRDSITKILEYLNNIKVFYSTGYRFFMDLDCIYLTSKSGKATLKKTDQSGVINITVKTVDNKSSLERGIVLQNNKSSYEMTVEAGDTNVDTSDLTDLQVDSITAVVDASKKKQENFLMQNKGFSSLLGTYKNIMNTIDKVKKAASQVRNIVKNIHKATYDIRGRLVQITEVATSFESTSKSLLADATAILDKLPTEALQALEKDSPGLLQGITKNIGITTGCFDGTIKNSVGQMDKLTKAYTGQIYNIENTKGLVGGISATLFSDNLNSLLGCTHTFENDKKNSSNALKDSLITLADQYANYHGAICNIKDILEKMPTKIEYTDPKQGSGGKDGGSTKVSIDLTPIKKYYAQIKDAAATSASNLKDIKQDKKTMQDSVKTNENVSNSMTKVIQGAKGIPLNFKTKMLEGYNSSVSKIKKDYQEGVKETTKNYQEIKGEVSNLMDVFGSIKDDTITSISNIKDLSNIGEGGESMVTISLDVAEIASDLSKRKIIRIPNDNINILKNIKHALELRKERVVLHKLELDNSLFTINKQYTITFVETNNTYTGNYILNEVQETYVNGGTQFSCNTLLNFSKLPKSSK